MSKTIFISLLSNVVVENFSIPEGVLDVLMKKKEKGVKIIFLSDNVFRPKLERFLSDDVRLEEIKKYPPEGILEKIFHFFYSYLIFTGTTKILATFGARVDVPPAGRNRHFAPLKALVARTFGRSRWIKTKVIPWLYFKIFRKRPYRALFDRYTPELVFVPNIAFFPDIELVAEAKRRGIKTVGMACNWDHLNKYYIPMHADILLVQNEPMKEEAVTLHEYDEAAIVPVGFPQFDVYAKKELVFSREEFCKKFDIPLQHRIILFISGAAYSQDEPDILQGILNEIEKGTFGEATLMIRPYAIVRDLDREREKYKMFEGKNNVVFNWARGGEGIVQVENRRLFLSMIAHADVIISIFSTTAIEAALLDRPTITIGFDGYKKRPYHQSIRRLQDMSHFKNVLQTGSVKVVYNFNELFSVIIEYLEHPEKDKNKREALVTRMCHKADGMASERIAEYLLHCL